MTEATRSVKMHDILDLALYVEEGDYICSIGSSLYEWAHPVTDDDIKKYIDGYEGHEEYSQDDLNEYTKTLTEWRDYHLPTYLTKIKEQQEEC